MQQPPGVPFGKNFYFDLEMRYASTIPPPKVFLNSKDGAPPNTSPKTKKWEKFLFPTSSLDVANFMHAYP
jgi:hypothetical protein